MLYIITMSKPKKIKDYENRHNINFPKSVITVIKRVNNVIYFNTEFGECKRLLSAFGRSNFSVNSALNKTEFLKRRFVKIHGDRYDYSKVIYRGSKSKIKIICKEHGVFEQISSSHMFGIGCKDCGDVSTKAKRNLDTKTFIVKANKIHNFKYNYNKTNYTISKNKVVIICDKHGEFNQCANAHLMGRGCKECGFDTIRKYIKIIQ